jgi:hypothetical protein
LSYPCWVSLRSTLRFVLFSLRISPVSIDWVECNETNIRLRNDQSNPSPIPDISSNFQNPETQLGRVRFSYQMHPAIFTGSHNLVSTSIQKKAG